MGNGATKEWLGAWGYHSITPEKGKKAFAAGPLLDGFQTGTAVKKKKQGEEEKRKGNRREKAKGNL